MRGRDPRRLQGGPRPARVLCSGPALALSGRPGDASLGALHPLPSVWPRPSLAPGHAKGPQAAGGGHVAQGHGAAQTFPGPHRGPDCPLTPTPPPAGPPRWCWSRAPLTSTDGPSGGGVDAHGREAGRGQFALTLPVLGPIWGGREGASGWQRPGGAPGSRAAGRSREPATGSEKASPVLPREGLPPPPGTPALSPRLPVQVHAVAGALVPGGEDETGQQLKTGEPRPPASLWAPRLPVASATGSLLRPLRARPGAPWQPPSL